MPNLPGGLVCRNFRFGRDCAAAALHHLSELADVIDPAGNSGVVIINIHAGRNKVSARIVDLHLAAVRDTEQLVVVAGDKTDAVIVSILRMLFSIGASGFLDLLQRAKCNFGNYFTFEPDLLKRHHSGTGEGIANRIFQHFLIGDQTGVLSSAGSFIEGLIRKPRLRDRFLQVQVGFVIHQIKGFFLFKHQRNLSPFAKKSSQAPKCMTAM